MSETIEQYRNRILSNVEGLDPVAVQSATPAKLHKLITAADPETLSRKPAPGKWSIVEIVAHLAETELVGAYRIRTILSAPGTSIQAFDQDRWAENGNYAGRHIHASLELFSVIRRANLALFETLSAEQWQRYGIHAERGEESVRHIVRLFAGHDLNHLKQIEAILGPS